MAQKNYCCDRNSMGENIATTGGWWIKDPWKYIKCKCLKHVFLQLQLLGSIWKPHLLTTDELITAAAIYNWGYKQD